MRGVLAFSLLVLSAVPVARPDELIKAKPSREQLYAGKPFTIALSITAPGPLDNISVKPDYPPDFQIDPPKDPIPTTLPGGSSYTAIYTVTPPPNAHATTETYWIVFNLKYRHADNPSPNVLMTDSVEIPFQVTFSRERFYLWGMVGLFVGWFIKALGKLAGEQHTSPEQQVDAQQSRRRMTAFFSARSMSSALTSLAMGFLALLLLSRHNLPTGAIHDTLALGIGLGFLGDDQLLTRIHRMG